MRREGQESFLQQMADRLRQAEERRKIEQQSANQYLSEVNLYWEAYYLSNDGVCSFCGVSGVVNTRDRARDGAGRDQGRLQFCFCPKGQDLRSTTNDEEAEATMNALYSYYNDADFKAKTDRLLRQMAEERKREKAKV